MIAGLIRLVTGVQCRWLDDQVLHGPCLFYANHRSHLDAIAIWAALPPVIRQRTRPVAAEDYWQGRLRRCLAERTFNAILIPRRNIGRDNHPIDRMATAIDAGSSLILFPEGGRRLDEDDDAPGIFKPGLYHLARARPAIRLIPVWLADIGKILPKGEILPVPFIARATFGAALQIEPDECRTAFLERCRQALCALVPGQNGSIDEP